MTRTEFEALPSKKQKSYAKKQYDLVRKELIQDYWDNDNGCDRGGIRSQCHHCWEKGMGGSIPLWYYFQKEYLVMWSLALHHYYHFMPQHKWKRWMLPEIEIAEEKKSNAIKDNEEWLMSHG